MSHGSSRFKYRYSNKCFTNRFFKSMLLQRIIATVFFIWGITAAQAQMPAVHLKDINGKSVHTNQTDNDGKPIIISFFATWCKPCLRELTAINEVYEEWNEETGVKLIAVSIDEGANSFKVKPLARTQGWEFPIWLDANQELMRAMNVNAVPTLFLIDGKGNIAYRRTGYVEGQEGEIAEQIRKLCQ